MTRAKPEDAIHKAIYVWISQHTPCLVWHTPNGGTRDIREARNMKALGVRAGVADLCIIPPGGVAHFIETKAPKNGVVSAAQHDFRREVEVRGCRWGMARSKEEGLALYRSWDLPFSETLWMGAAA